MDKYLIYHDRYKIEDFGVDEKNSINNDLYNALFNTKYILSRPRKEEDILALFNDAYYICTKILIDKRPYFQISEYKFYLSNRTVSFLPDRYVIAMSMVLVYLKTLDLITDDIDKTINVIKSDVTNYNIAEYNKIISVARKDKTIKATNFLPLNYPDGDYSNYWECYNSFPKDLEKKVEEVITKEAPKGNAGKKEVNTSFTLSGENVDSASEEKRDYIIRLQKERDEWKKKYEELLKKMPEMAFNAQTKEPCFTSRQMGILLAAVGRLTEKNPPGKTTIGDVVQRIAGYKSRTGSQNMRGTISEADKKIVSDVLKSQFPNLANEVMTVY